MESIALFLGAGASRAFGYPTTTEFLDTLQRGYPSELKNVLNSMSEAESVSDIEHVLLFIDAVLSFNSAPHVSDVLKLRSPEIKILNEKMSWEAYLSRIQTLKKNIISSIYSAYEYKEDKRDEIKKYFDSFFESIFDIIPYETLDIFTTNYDSVIEEYALQSQHILINGFSNDRNGRYWNPDRLRDALPDEKSIRLLKLHGSLNWRLTQDDRIEWVKVEEERTRSQRYKENVLIYPTQKYLLNQKPYSTMFNIFTEICKDITYFVVIGCSFRDDYINTILLNTLQQASLKKLIAVSPHASNNIQNELRRSNSELFDSLATSQILSIDASFGKKETIEKIVESIYV